MYFRDVTDALVDKLNKLTEFQSFTVYRMIIEYWNWSYDNICNCLEEDGDLEGEAVREIFNI